MNMEKRRNAYAFTLLGCILTIALVGILNIWGLSIGETFSFKTITSLVVIAGLSGFLYTLTYNHDKKLIQKLGKIIGVIAVAFSAIILAQIWLDLFKDAAFIKILATLMIIGLLVAFGMAMSDDFFEGKKMKDENYLD